MLNLLSKGFGDIAKYNWEYHDMADEGLYKNSLPSSGSYKTHLSFNVCNGHCQRPTSYLEVFFFRCQTFRQFDFLKRSLKNDGIGIPETIMQS